MNVYFYSLGCKVNQYDTEAMSEEFRAAGWSVADEPDGADAIVVNSCTVTAESDRETRQAVRRFRRRAPAAAIVLAGCMPQAYPAQAAALTEADLVVGTGDRAALLRDLGLFLKQRAARGTEAARGTIVDVEKHTISEPFEHTEIEGFSGRTRAFIKVQDGCDRYCSYCIIPTARGHSRSRPLPELEAELTKMKTAGFREVVLVGINFCCYGLDIGKSFADPIELACGMGFDRVRIGSLEFDNITEESVARLAKLPNFCPQFHMSLQSGCDETLKRMRRHYTTAEYEATCRLLRASFPDASITTDIMVGFPLETEENFEETEAFAKRIGFEKIHVFPYSPREGTKAAEMRPQLSKAVKEDRCRRMMKTAATIRKTFLEQQIGRTVRVLGETFEDGQVTGYTENYTPVRFPSAYSRHNEIVRVNITGTDGTVCFGRPAPEIQL